MAHFATFLAQEHGDLIRALAAYNAGPSRVTLWNARKGVSDPEVFVERIPFVETRDYVRAILRGREIYRVLYGLNAKSAEQQGR
jgi:soluble lytic murein transglycosylase